MKNKINVFLLIKQGQQYLKICLVIFSIWLKLDNGMYKKNNCFTILKQDWLKTYITTWVKASIIRCIYTG